MSSTPLYVLMQPKISNSYWVTNIMAGIDRAHTKYHDKLFMLDSASMNGLSDLFYSLYKMPVLVIGSDTEWIERSINMLTAYESVPILVNASMLPVHHCSGVVFELEEAMLYCRAHLKQSGRERIAFLGAHSHSASDIAKCNAFNDIENTYTADYTIESCVDSFLEIMPTKKYNGIICANDTVAIYLINKMVENGYRIPDDCYVIGMGDSCLAANHSVSVSSVAFDYTQMGEQAVNLYHTLSKMPSPCRYTVSLPCCLIVRESAGGTSPIVLPVRANNSGNSADSGNDDMYFTGVDAQKILELEAILQKCDSTDRSIVFGLMKGKTNEEISEEVYLTPRAVRYRINNFFKRYTEMSQNEFLMALKRILL